MHHRVEQSGVNFVGAEPRAEKGKVGEGLFSGPQGITADDQKGSMRPWSSKDMVCFISSTLHLCWPVWMLNNALSEGRNQLQKKKTEQDSSAQFLLGLWARLK